MEQGVKLDLQKLLNCDILASGWNFIRISGFWLLLWHLSRFIFLAISRSSHCIHNTYERLGNMCQTVLPQIYVTWTFGRGELVRHCLLNIASILNENETPGVFPAFILFLVTCTLKKTMDLNLGKLTKRCSIFFTFACEHFFVEKR